MTEINISSHLYKNDKTKTTIITLDSMRENWDSESQGKEPDYDSFIKFLAELVIDLSDNKQIYASFTERNDNSSLIKKLKNHQLTWVSYPLFLPEVIMNFIFNKLHISKNFGTGVAVKVQSKTDILKIIELNEKPNEWLFFYIGNLKNPSLLSKYQPFYLSKKEKSYDFNVFSDASFVVYHESNLIYSEIILSNSKASTIISKIQDVYQRKKDEWGEISLRTVEN